MTDKMTKWQKRWMAFDMLSNLADCIIPLLFALQAKYDSTTLDTVCLIILAGILIVTIVSIKMKKDCQISFVADLVIQDLEEKGIKGFSFRNAEGTDEIFESIKETVDESIEETVEKTPRSEFDKGIPVEYMKYSVLLSVVPFFTVVLFIITNASVKIIGAIVALAAIGTIANFVLAARGKYTTYLTDNDIN